MEKKLAPIPCHLLRPTLIAVLLILLLYFPQSPIISSSANGVSDKSTNITSLAACVKGEISQRDVYVKVLKAIPRKQLPYIDYTLKVRLADCSLQAVEVYALYSSTVPAKCGERIEGGLQIPFNMTRGGENNSSSNILLVSFSTLKSLTAMVRIQCREGLVDITVKPRPLGDRGGAVNSSSSTQSRPPPEPSPVVTGTSMAASNQHLVEGNNNTVPENIVYYSIVLATLSILLLGYVQEKRYLGKEE